MARHSGQIRVEAYFGEQHRYYWCCCSACYFSLVDRGTAAVAIGAFPYWPSGSLVDLASFVAVVVAVASCVVTLDRVVLVALVVVADPLPSQAFLAFLAFPLAALVHHDSGLVQSTAERS